MYPPHVTLVALVLSKDTDISHRTLPVTDFVLSRQRSDVRMCQKLQFLRWPPEAQANLCQLVQSRNLGLV